MRVGSCGSVCSPCLDSIPYEPKRDWLGALQLQNGSELDEKTLNGRQSGDVLGGRCYFRTWDNSSKAHGEECATLYCSCEVGAGGLTGQARYGCHEQLIDTPQRRLRKSGGKIAG